MAMKIALDHCWKEFSRKSLSRCRDRRATLKSIACSEHSGFCCYFSKSTRHAAKREHGALTQERIARRCWNLRRIHKLPTVVQVAAPFCELCGPPIGSPCARVALGEKYADGMGVVP